MANLERERERQLLKEIPDILDFKTLLYIGAKPERLQMVDLFFARGYAIDVLEAWRPNVEALLEWQNGRRIKTFRKIVRGNIRTDCLPEKYDVVMFWHGPEHLTREDLPFALTKAETMATRFVVLASPWGRYAQGDCGGNPFERHVSHLYEIDLEAFGYRTSTLGRKDKKDSNLLAWKRLESAREAL